MYDALDMISRDEADLSLVTFGVSSKQTQYATFTTPIDYLSFGFLMKELGRRSTPLVSDQLHSQDFIFRVFAPIVYISVFAATLLTSAILVMTRRLRPRDYPVVLGQNLAVLFRQHEIQQGAGSGPLSACVSSNFFDWLRL